MTIIYTDDEIEPATRASQRAKLLKSIPGLRERDEANAAEVRARARFGREFRKDAQSDKDAWIAACRRCAVVLVAHPHLVPWAEIEAYTEARNSHKRAAGDAAVEAVLSGEPINEARDAMVARWLGQA